MFGRSKVHPRFLAALGLTCASGLACAQEAEPTKAPSSETGEPTAETESPKRLIGSKTLFGAELSDATRLMAFERETRKMKGAPTPEDLRLSEEQLDAAGELFSAHREAVRAYKTEHASKIAKLRRDAGLVTDKPKAAEGEAEPAPAALHYFDGSKIEPGNKKPDPDALKPGEVELTPEQAEAREELRALLDAGPLVDDVSIQVLAALDEPQRIYLEEQYEKRLEEMRRRRLARLKTEATGRLKVEDLSPEVQRKMADMKPSVRQAWLDRIRMERIVGGPRKRQEQREQTRRAIKSELDAIEAAKEEGNEGQDGVDEPQTSDDGS